MLHYRLLCVGRRAQDPLLEAAEGYLERLSHYAKVEVVRIRESDPKREAEALLNKLRPRERVVALDEHAEELTTRGLAERIERWQRVNLPGIALVLGGADGLGPALKARADEALALSRLTLPHRLALVLLCEQLYRAHTLLKGQPYHRG